MKGCNGYEDCAKSIAGRWRLVVKGYNGYEDCVKSSAGRWRVVVMVMKIVQSQLLGDGEWL